MCRGAEMPRNKKMKITHIFPVAIQIDGIQNSISSQIPMIYRKITIAHFEI